MGGRRRAAENEREQAPAEERRPVLGAPAPTTRPAHGAAGMLELQRTIGNQAVRRLVGRPVLQAKLHVGPAGDSFEREADQVADDVMRHLTTTVTPNDEENRLSRSLAEGVVGLEGGPLGADAEAAIQGGRGQGSPLPGTLRRSMEGAFGAGFGGVRVHAGPSADALNQSMQSRAFTVGGDIYFAKGQYQPGSTSGRRLLAHELTHTVQQGAAPTVTEVAADEH